MVQRAFDESTRPGVKITIGTRIVPILPIPIILPFVHVAWTSDPVVDKRQSRRATRVPRVLIRRRWTSFHPAPTARMRVTVGRCSARLCRWPN